MTNLQPVDRPIFPTLGNQQKPIATQIGRFGVSYGEKRYILAEDAFLAINAAIAWPDLSAMASKMVLLEKKGKISNDETVQIAKAHVSRVINFPEATPAGFCSHVSLDKEQLCILKYVCHSSSFANGAPIFSGIKSDQAVALLAPLVEPGAIFVCNSVLAPEPEINLFKHENFHSFYFDLDRVSPITDRMRVGYDKVIEVLGWGNWQRAMWGDDAEEFWTSGYSGSAVRCRVRSRPESFDIVKADEDPLSTFDPCQLASLAIQQAREKAGSDTSIKDALQVFDRLATLATHQANLDLQVISGLDLQFLRQ